MPRIIRIQLSEAQRQELLHVRAHHGKAFLRERAAAVLKVGEGALIQHVAENGLLKRHEPETVKGWIEQYLRAGLAGWQIKAGRGRKPNFSPSAADNAGNPTD
jgi:transposase